MTGARLEDQVGKFAPDHSENSISHKSRKHSWSEQRWICVVESALLTLRKRWSIWCDAPALRVCDRLRQNALARLRAAKHE